MKRTIKIGNREIGDGCPTFIIAEMSGNHNMDFNRAVAIVEAAKAAGADAIKLQTYTADTITLNSDSDYFMIRDESLWGGRSLYNLYQEAYTPWDWQPKLKKIADDLGIVLFSSPFDYTAIDFLEKMDVPAYKIASYEINDTPLIRYAAKTGKPIIISTGIATISDISKAVEACHEVGNENVILLKCTSSYPCPYEEMNIRTIPNLSETFGCLSGLSDHTYGDEVAIASVALGAHVVEKHMTLKRSDGGVDSAFSMEADEFAHMVRHIRNAEKALGKVTYNLSKVQKDEKKSSRSLFVSKNIKAGEKFTVDNIKSVRPGYGLDPALYDKVIGKTASRDLEFAKPLELKDIVEDL